MCIRDRNKPFQLKSHLPDATLIGRAYLYGLGALGERGVTQALEILHKELDMTMALCGHRVINEVDRDIFSSCPF